MRGVDEMQKAPQGGKFGIRQEREGKGRGGGMWIDEEEGTFGHVPVPRKDPCCGSRRCSRPR